MLPASLLSLVYGSTRAKAFNQPCLCCYVLVHSLGHRFFFSFQVEHGHGINSYSRTGIRFCQVPRPQNYTTLTRHRSRWPTNDMTSEGMYPGNRSGATKIHVMAVLHCNGCSVEAQANGDKKFPEPFEPLANVARRCGPEPSILLFLL